MKQLILLVLSLFITGTVVAQEDAKDIRKERKEIRKMTRSELNEKASKVARKEAKKYAKDGWTVVPGGLPIEKQLDKSYNMQYEYDDDMFPKYIMGEAMSIGDNYDAAKMQALELAKQNLAGQIQTEVTALVENTVANKQLEPNQAASIVQSVSASKNLISQSIGRVLPIIEMYRTKKDGTKEVLLRVAYNSEMAKQAAKNAIKKTLEEKGEDLHQQLDKLLGVK
jgi:hypothetical protein